MNISVRALSHKVPLCLAIIAAFMVFLDNTIVNVALPAITHDLYATRADVEWVVNAYALSLTAVMLGAGAITDSIGAKKVYLLGILIFALSSAACACADSILFLNISRLTQGIGAALIVPSALVLVTRSAVNEQQRYKFIGLYAAAGGLGMAIGPLLGGVLIQIYGWQLIFWINVILGGIGTLIGIYALSATPGHAHKSDLGGQLTATTAIAGIFFICIEAPAWGWEDMHIIIAIVIAALGIMAFIYIEKTIENPLLPVIIYKNKKFLGVTMQGALFNFTFYGLLFGLSIFLQEQLHYDPWDAGLIFLPLNGMIFVANTQIAKISERMERSRLMLLCQIGLTIALFGTAYCIYDRNLIGLLIFLACIGFIAGLLVPTMTTQSISTVDDSLHGAASAAFNTLRQIGGAIGVAVYGPLLGTDTQLGSGFIICILIGAIATIITAVLTIATQKSAVNLDKIDPELCNAAHN